MAEITTALAAVGIAICSCVVSLIIHFIKLRAIYMVIGLNHVLPFVRLRLIEGGEWRSCYSILKGILIVL